MINNKRIDLNEAENLSNLFSLRIQRSKDDVGFRSFNDETTSWDSLTWGDMAEHVCKWQAALKVEQLSPGDRVAVMLNNCPEWVMFEQAALGIGLVVVPLYTNDRPDNISYIVNDSDITVILFHGDGQWNSIKEVISDMPSVKRYVSIKEIDDHTEDKLLSKSKWLDTGENDHELTFLNIHKSALATIVYTSGTTGRPKGVMLSHGNILWNASSSLDAVGVTQHDTFLSFLPLSHMLERTVGYYVPMLSGATINYARSIETLAEDLLTVHPTILITVPRIFERVYNKIHTQLEKKSFIAKYLFNSAINVGWYRFLFKQNRKPWHPKILLWPLLYFLVGKKVMRKLGGKMRIAISGGAPLSADVAKTFIGLGLTISQGYGLTETSPVVCTNLLDDNDPTSVGQALHDVEVKIGDNNELMIRGPGVMLGYWKNESATNEIINADGWLSTGDKADIKRDHIYITGRIKEILVLSNGEKVPPTDIEMAITKDPMFEQALLVGEGKSFLSVITVLNMHEWNDLAASMGIGATDENLNHPHVCNKILDRIRMQITDFPGYAKIFRVLNTNTVWTIENGMLTPTLKVRRKQILEKYEEPLHELYKGHE